MPDTPASVSLTPRQKRASRYLGLGLSQRAAARRLGMDDRTLRRWLTDVPGFREAVEEHRLAGEDDDTENAKDVLRDLLNSQDERVRLGAAARLLSTVKSPAADDDEDAEALAAWK